MGARFFFRSAFTLSSLILGLAASPMPAMAQSSLCAEPTAFCQRQLSPACVNRLGAGSIATEAPAVCDAELNNYRECLALVASQCGATDDSAGGASRGAGDAATMTMIWNEVKDSGDVAALESFAETYPGTPLAALARRKVDELRGGGGQNAALAAACIEAFAAVQPFLEKATSEGRALVASGDPGGNYSLPAYYYQSSAGNLAFERAHEPRIERWRNAAAALRVVMPAEKRAMIDYFDGVVLDDIPAGRFISQAEMIDWLRTLEAEGRELVETCRAFSQ